MKSRSETTLNERDSLCDLLFWEERLADCYAEALRAASDRAIGEELWRLYGECEKTRRRVYEELLLRGYIRETPASRESLAERVGRFQKAEKELFAD